MAAATPTDEAAAATAWATASANAEAPTGLDPGEWVNYIALGVSDTGFRAKVLDQVNKLIDDATYEGLLKFLKLSAAECFGGDTPYCDRFVPRMKELARAVLKDRDEGAVIQTENATIYVMPKTATAARVSDV